MILEHAILQVRPGSAERFRAAFDQARLLIEASPGFRGLQLLPCIEDADRYLLLVEWETLEDHLDGFRGGPDHPRWRESLHHFYEPVPEVDHYRLAGSGDRA